MYYLAHDGQTYDDGLGDVAGAYGLDVYGRRFALEPEVATHLTARYYADHPPEAIGGLSSEHIAEIRGRFPIGDVIARLTSALGVKPCAPCKRRQATLNQFGDRMAKFWPAR